MSQYKPSALTRTYMIECNVPTLPALRDHVRPILTDTLATFEKLNWIQHEETVDEHGIEHSPMFCDDQSQLDEICGACLTGAIWYSIMKRGDTFPATSQQRNTFRITNSFISDILRDEPENEVESLIWGREQFYIQPYHWNDNLEPETGEQRVVTMLNRAIQTLSEL